MGEENLKTYITNYYKRPFGASEPSNVILDEDRTQDIAQISIEENEILTANFTEKEVFEAIS